MGFWDTVGKVAGAGFQKLQETGLEAREKYDQYEGYSDQQLMDKHRRGNLTDRMATSKLLQERGYRRNSD